MTDSNGVSTTRGAPRPPADRGITTDFDWVVYADATFAGLSVLLPTLFVDALLEEYFRRRMPRDIARRRGRVLSKAAIREVNRMRDGGFMRGCLLWPVDLIIYLVQNIYRTLIYLFTIVDAADKLSLYWHRAFLLDYMIAHDHLDTADHAAVSAEAMRRVLRTTKTSPVRNLAQETIDFAARHVRGLFRAVFRFLRRKEQTAEFRRERQTIATRWAEFHDYFVDLAATYEKTYALVKRERELATATVKG